jgi:predicted NUDIX family NTP pyrophosphohydrolase
MDRSAGLLPYRWSGSWQVLIAHPGGPFWARRDRGAWSIIKGLVDPGEDPEAAARREFTEETGWAPPEGDLIDLGEIRLRSGKVVRAWAVAADLDPATIQPGHYVTARGGKQASFPEIDRVEWVAIPDARAKLNPAYGPHLDRLEAQLPAGG